MSDPPGEWRLLVTPPAPGWWNMALDEALLESVRDGAPPALRFYSWEPPCLSLGRNQPARGQYAAERLRALRIDVVRRPTGGRAVLHADELTYSVVAPARRLGSARMAYRSINETLLAGLIALGAPADIKAGADRIPVPSTAPCFAEPVPGELLAGGRKLLGSAQLCRDGVLLQHGALPLRPSPLEREVFAGQGDRGTPAYLESVLRRPLERKHLEDALSTAWRARLGPLVPSTPGDAELSAVERLAPRYRDEDWTWRG